MFNTAEIETETIVLESKIPHGAENGVDHFIEREGVVFAGNHLLVDLWGASRIDDTHHIDATLREAALEAGATILHGHFHHFTPNGGVSGVLVLAESHISIHTWPERNFAALDVFMCGDCDPMRTLAIFQKAFNPSKIEADERRRGIV